MSAAAGGSVVISGASAGMTVLPTGTATTLTAAAAYFGGDCVENLCTNVPSTAITSHGFFDETIISLHFV